MRNTTLAFVTLSEGERDFAFYRHDTADFHINAEQVDFGAFEDLEIVHLGSLMLSEPCGRELADIIVQKTQKAGALLSFDVNFRKDIFGSFDSARAAYLPYVKRTDILKFSEDELYEFTGISDMGRAVASLEKENSLVVVTLGKRGCAYFYGDMCGEVPTVPAQKIVDTTGAGDSFFGTMLAHLEGKPFTKENIERAIARGNEAGARTVGFKGAIRL